MRNERERTGECGSEIDRQRNGDSEFRISSLRSSWSFVSFRRIYLFGIHKNSRETRYLRCILYMSQCTRNIVKFTFVSGVKKNWSETSLCCENVWYRLPINQTLFLLLLFMILHYRRILFLFSAWLICARSQDYKKTLNVSAEYVFWRNDCRDDSRESQWLSMSLHRNQKFQFSPMIFSLYRPYRNASEEKKQLEWSHTARGEHARQLWVFAVPAQIAFCFYSHFILHRVCVHRIKAWNLYSYISIHTYTRRGLIYFTNDSQILFHPFFGAINCLYSGLSWKISYSYAQTFSFIRQSILSVSLCFALMEKF